MCVSVYTYTYTYTCFPGGWLSGKESTCNAGATETQVQSLGQEDHVEEGMASDSSSLAWRIPWIEEPGGLQLYGHKELDMTEATVYACIYVYTHTHTHTHTHIYMCIYIYST